MAVEDSRFRMAPWVQLELLARERREVGLLCASGTGEEQCACFGMGGNDPEWTCFEGMPGAGGRGGGTAGAGGRGGMTAGAGGADVGVAGGAGAAGRGGRA